jgi:hypothetical protein
MGFLVFSCPIKGMDFSSHIHTDAATIAAVEKAPVTLHCPVCGGVHRMTVRHGRLASARQSAAA